MQKHTKNGNKPLSALADTQIDLGAYRIADPEAFGRNFLRLMDESTRAMHRQTAQGVYSQRKYG